MSASRERKQRQDGVGDLTPRQRRDLKETRAAKRNQTLYIVLGVVAAALIAALLIWDSDILKGNPTAATVNGQEFNASQAAYYYGNIRQQEMQMSSFYQQFGQQFGMALYDSTKADSEQIQDEASGTTFSEYFKTQSLETMKRVTMLCDQAAAEQMTLSEDGKQSVKDNVLSAKTYAAQNGMAYSGYLKAMFGKLMTVKIFETELAREVLASEYQTAKQESFVYDEDQLEAYYEENASTMDTYAYRYAQIDGKPAAQTDADGNPVTASEAEIAAAMSQAKIKADLMSADLNGGSDFNTTASQYVADAEKDSYLSDPDYRHNTGDLGSNLSGYSYGDWITSTDPVRKTGEIGIIEDTANSCYYVVQFLNRWRAEDTRATVDARHILVKAELSEGATEPTEEQYNVAKAEIERLQAEWEAGDKSTDSFAALAKANSDDLGSAEEGGLIAGITPGQTVAQFNDFLFEANRQVADVGVVQNTQSGQQGYHLIYVDALGEIAWKGTAISALRSTDYTEWYDGVIAGYEVVAVDEGMNMIVK